VTAAAGVADAPVGEQPDALGGAPQLMQRLVVPQAGVGGALAEYLRAGRVGDTAAGEVDQALPDHVGVRARGVGAARVGHRGPAQAGVERAAPGGEGGRRDELAGLAGQEGDHRLPRDPVYPCGLAQGFLLEVGALGFLDVE
jgi:hypothetical protein